MPNIVRCTIFKVRNIQREVQLKKQGGDTVVLKQLVHVPVYCEIRLGTSGLLSQYDNLDSQSHFGCKKTEVFNEGDDGSALAGGVFDFENLSDEVLQEKPLEILVRENQTDDGLIGLV